MPSDPNELVHNRNAFLDVVAAHNVTSDPSTGAVEAGNQHVDSPTMDRLAQCIFLSLRRLIIHRLADAEHHIVLVLQLPLFLSHSVLIPRRLRQLGPVNTSHEFTLNHAHLPSNRTGTL